MLRKNLTTLVGILGIAMLLTSCGSSRHISLTSNPSDATLSLSSTIKGVAITSFGTTIVDLNYAPEKWGEVTIDTIQAANTSNAGDFVTLFTPTNENAKVKVVKYPTGVNPSKTFDTDAVYANGPIADKDFFVVRVTSENGINVVFYVITITVVEAVVPPPDPSLSGEVTIASNFPLEATALDTDHIASTLNGVVLNVSGAGLAAIGSGDVPSSILNLSSNASGLGMIADSVPVFDITNSNEVLSITLSYSGTEVLEYCTVNDPFQSFECAIGSNVTMTRQGLSDALGDSKTASISIRAGTAADGFKDSNTLTMQKYKITQVSNITTQDYPRDLVALGGQVYFIANSSAGMYQVFKYDGTNITQITHDNLSKGALTVFNDALYFSAWGNNASKLYKYDGSSITKISNINTSCWSSDDIDSLKVFNGALYFSAKTACSNRKLYKYDGTSITQISNINPIGSDNPYYLTEYNGALYFTATNDNSWTQKLYKYNGTNIIQVSNIISGSSDSPSALTVFNGALYFLANSDTKTTQIFKYDGTDLTRVSKIDNGGYGISGRLTEFNGALYFAVDTATNPDVIDSFYKLFKYDGTSITQVSNINDGGSDSPDGMMVFNGALYFAAKDNSNLSKLYKYDGTNIVKISNIHSGDEGPEPMAVVNGAMYFKANIDNSGNAKLYKLE